MRDSGKGLAQGQKYLMAEPQVGSGVHWSGCQESHMRGLGVITFHLSLSLSFPQKALKMGRRAGCSVVLRACGSFGKFERGVDRGENRPDF